MPGRYNLSNAAAAYCVGSLLGISHQDLLTGIASFTGTLRRFQLVGRVADVSVFDDYAHHPTELRATLGAARRVVTGQGGSSPASSLICFPVPEISPGSSDRRLPLQTGSSFPTYIRPVRIRFPV